jgi:hypothetical protein
MIEFIEDKRKKDIDYKVIAEQAVEEKWEDEKKKRKMEERMEESEA